MATRLTDKQKKKIVADYIELGSYRAVSRKHNVSVPTVKRVCESNSDTLQKVTQKRDENTAEILAHMDGKKAVVNEIIDTYLAALLDPIKIKRATPAQLTTALGTLIDKFTDPRLNESAGVDDDGLMEALKDNAAEVFGDGDDSGMLPDEGEGE